jgi:hypothetical protein
MVLDGVRLRWRSEVSLGQCMRRSWANALALGMYCWITLWRALCGGHGESE